MFLYENWPTFTYIFLEQIRSRYSCVRIDPTTKYRSLETGLRINTQLTSYVNDKSVCRESNQIFVFTKTQCHSRNRHSDRREESTIVEAQVFLKESYATFPIRISNVYKRILSNHLPYLQFCCRNDY